MTKCKFLTAITFLSISCSVKINTHEPIGNVDSDGDLILDKDELSMGMNPLVANIPEIQADFSKDYSIRISYKDSTQSSSRTMYLFNQPLEDSPPIDKIMSRSAIKVQSLKEIARISALHQSHSDRLQIDKLNLQYFDINEGVHLLHLNRLSKLSKNDIHNASVSHNIEVKLISNDYFSTITNIKIKFSYFDYKNSKYVELKTIIIEDILESGIPKIHHNQITDLSTELILNNYYNRGEFIISEIIDFDIPKLKTTYKKLISSVKRKSIPVIYSDPLRDTIYYVSLQGKKKETKRNSRQYF